MAYSPIWEKAVLQIGPRIDRNTPGKCGGLIRQNRVSAKNSTNLMEPIQLHEYATTSPNTLVENAGRKAVQNYIRKRAVKVGKYIIRTSATVGQTADVFGISKSTVHKDVSERLPRINKE